nr:zinc finger, CCHC-type [Tanacetum cinerariifolium]
MHNMGKTVNELHAMLKLHEEMRPKKDANPALHAIRAGRVQKNQKNKPHKAAKGGHGKGKGKMGHASNNALFAPKPKNPPPPKKDNPGLRGSKKLKPGALSLPSKNKVFVARNAEFFESKLLNLKASGSVEDLELIQEEDTNPFVDTSLNHEEDDQEIDEPKSDINPI